MNSETKARTLFKRSARPIIEPMSALDWASGAVFNPGAWYDGDRVHLLFRAVPEGYRRVSVQGGAPGEVDTGFEDYVSAIGYASSRDGVHFEVRPEPFLLPDAPFDRFGAEDARISKIDDRYLITYTALSRPAFGEEDGVRIGLASTKDFRTMKKHGIVGPPRRDKDAVIFPRRIGGKIMMLHRIHPDVQLIAFDSLESLMDPSAGVWEDHLATLDRHVVLSAGSGWEEKKVGAGPTPIETPDGWLFIYHGVDQSHVYRAGVALLDLQDPSRVIARLPWPILEPETDYERNGDVPNVVFPEGAVVMGDALHVYYGGADRVVGHASASLADLLELLRQFRR